ncbi:hypothetical protein [Aquimarina sp. 2201CG14-23]|uniref:hypothetical protein n=1 Tax=Aquimarina mycalae TaxID=3040073 RepID=UPI00247829F4|nr:hypothetical protein [Aquimarina sp. 2201CG14-23]MDH7445857.1 hypothetical protein [Aquimarina sp. 2201CG14-23]
MSILLRTCLAIFVFITIYLFTYVVMTYITPETLITLIVSQSISILLAILSMMLVYKKTIHISNDLATHIVVGGFIVGPIVFFLDYFVPVIITPTSHQGPLIGVFIAGPIGFVVGLISGLIYWKTRGKRQLVKVDNRYYF